MKHIFNITLMLYASSLFAAESLVIQNGTTITEAKSLLGAPDGNISIGNNTDLYFSGVRLQFIDGVATNLPENVVETIIAARVKLQQEAEFKTKQMNLGLVLFQGDWVSKEEYKKRRDASLIEQAKRRDAILIEQAKRRAADHKIEVDKYIERIKKRGPITALRIYREDGSIVDHSPLATPNRVVIAEFHQEGAFECSIVQKRLEQFVNSDPCIHYRRIEFPRGKGPIVQQFGLKYENTIRVIDQYGRLVGDRPPSTIEQWDSLVKQAKRQSDLK